LTTLIGIQGPDFVVMGADSQITDNDQRIISTQTPKIVRKGKYLLGVTGDSRPGDILIYNWKPPLYKNQDPVEWMGRVVIPSIYNAFKDNGYEPNDKEANFCYLISFDANLFSIGPDLSFNGSENGLFTAGSGGPYALGYLYSLKPSSYKSLLMAKVIAERAVKIASVLDINTCPPIQLETQERGWE
jgi:ATP-dependent protease HslVU (ClpYQ) peptidase subunit